MAEISQVIDFVAVVELGFEAGEPFVQRCGKRFQIGSQRIDQRGFRVALVSGDAFRELLKTRCWVEERALRESIEHGDVEWEENIVLANHRLDRTPRSTDNHSYVANSEWEPKHKQLHMALLSACDSSILLKFCGQLYDQNIRYRNISGTVAYSQRNTNDEHNQIVKLVLERNAD